MLVHVPEVEQVRGMQTRFVLFCGLPKGGLAGRSQASMQVTHQVE